MRSLNTNSSTPTKKVVLVIIGILIVTAIAAMVWFFIHQNKSSEADNSAPRPVNSVDYSGPTDDEAKAGNQQKEANKRREELDKQPAASEAVLVLTDASQYNNTIEVRAYSSNIYQSTGKCTATFTKSGQQPITTTSDAFTDAKTTQCGALDTPRSSFPEAGTWSVVVSYQSTTASGSTQAKDIIIK